MQPEPVPRPDPPNAREGASGAGARHKGNGQPLHGVDEDSGCFRIILIDPSALSRSCFVAALEGVIAVEIAGVAEVDGLSAACIEQLRPDVIALRIASETLSAEQLAKRLERLGRIFPPARTMVLARDEAPDRLLQVVAMGLGGFITTDLGVSATVKAMEMLREGLCVYSHASFQSLRRLTDTLAPKRRERTPRSGPSEDGSTGLTARQNEVLQLLLDGMANKAIAFSLGISESTVKVHVRAIMERAGVTSRAQIIAGFLGERR